MALWKFGHFKLFSKISQKLFELSKISQNLFELGADKGWWVDYLIKLKKNHFIFSELWPFENLGILNLSARYLENYLS